VSEPPGRRNEPMTHPDPDVLAEFRAGLVPGRPGARISAHLSACEHCASLCGELAEISALLAAIPPAAIPDQVAHQLDDVLAAEVARRDKSEQAVVHRTIPRPSSPPSRRHRDLRLVTLRVLAPAAAVVVLAAGGYGLSRLAGRPAATAASRAAAATVAPPRSTTLTSPLRLRPDAIPATGAGFQLVSSQTDYRRANLLPQVRQEVQRSARAALGPQEPAPASVKACVHRLTQGVSPGTVVLAETAYFQGQHALVIVAAAGARDVAWVTTVSCSGSGADLLDETTFAGTSAP
jgi:hypothetical protein